MTRIAGWRIASNGSATREACVRPFPGPGSRWQVASNGQRFLVTGPLESAMPAPVTVVTNWTAGLKK